LANKDDWSQRSVSACAKQWQELRGTLAGYEVIDEPARIAGQIAGLLQVRERAQPATDELSDTPATEASTSPAPRPDLHALFLAADPLQARQIKPTLVFQYAGDLPVYATSRTYRLSLNNEPNPDIDGLMRSEEHTSEL